MNERPDDLVGLKDCIAAQKRRVSALSGGKKRAVLTGTASRRLSEARSILFYMERIKELKDFLEAPLDSEVAP